MITKKFNILITLLVILSSLFLVIGCSRNESQTKNPSVPEIRDQIAKSVDISQLTEQDGETLAMLYQINTDDIEEFVLYMAPTNLQADELAIIKVKDGVDVSKIKEQIAQRVEQQTNSFKDYLPEQYDLIEKHVLKSKANYILLAISENVDEIEDIFDNSFN